MTAKTAPAPNPVNDLYAALRALCPDADTDALAHLVAKHMIAAEYLGWDRGYDAGFNNGRTAR